MAASESSIASSMLTSMSWAPFSTWSRAIATPASKSPARIRFANAREPVTLVRSPTLTKRESGPISTASRPASLVRRGSLGTARGAIPRTAAATARTCAGVVPQQPPTRLTSPSRANPPRTLAVSAGASS